MNSNGGKILLFDTGTSQAKELPIEDYGDLKLMGPHGMSSWKESGAFVGFTYLYNVYKSYIVRRVLAAITYGVLNMTWVCTVSALFSFDLTLCNLQQKLFPLIECTEKKTFNAILDFTSFFSINNL